MPILERLVLRCTGADGVGGRVHGRLKKMNLKKLFNNGPSHGFQFQADGAQKPEGKEDANKTPYKARIPFRIQFLRIILPFV